MRPEGGSLLAARKRTFGQPNSKATHLFTRHAVNVTHALRSRSMFTAGCRKTKCMHTTSSHAGQRHGLRARHRLQPPGARRAPAGVRDRSLAGDAGGRRAGRPTLLQCARWPDTSNAVLKLLDAEHDGCVYDDRFHLRTHARRVRDFLRRYVPCPTQSAHDSPPPSPSTPKETACWFTCGPCGDMRAA
jgi:hypothetical protein